MLDDDICQLITELRTSPIRELDQIHMCVSDLLEQARRTAPLMAGRKVVFVGDNDLASVATIASCAHGYLPQSVTLVDFDQRVLDAVSRGFASLNLETLLHTERYNVFQAPPERLVGQHDAFYTNPPYGQYNGGASICLFVQRGFALCNPFSSTGIVIMPAGGERPWTGTGNRNVVDFAKRFGWTLVAESVNEHRYALDDDPALASRAYFFAGSLREPKSIGRLTAEADERLTVNFYGRSVRPPYPEFIDDNGVLVYRPLTLERAS